MYEHESSHDGTCAIREDLRYRLPQAITAIANSKAVFQETQDKVWSSKDARRIMYSRAAFSNTSKFILVQLAPSDPEMVGGEGETGDRTATPRETGIKDKEDEAI